MARTTAGQRQLVRNFGTCLNFGKNASTDKATWIVPTSMDPANLTALTAAIWINPASISNNSAPKLFFNDGSSDKGFGIQLTNSNGTINATLFTNGTDGAASSPAGTAKLNTWQRILMTFQDGWNNPKLFFNGVEVTSSPVSLTGSRINWSGVTANIGNATASNRVLLGFIDEFCIWNRVLSDTEITQDYYTGSPTAGLLLQYRMDEGSGTSLTDSSTSGITGTITGATYSTNVFIIPRTISGTRTLAGTRSVT